MTSSIRKQRGFNLLESAIVLGIVGLVIGGIWIAAAAVSDKHKANTFVEGIQLIQSGVFRLYKAQPLPASITNVGVEMNAAGIIPGYFTVDASGYVKYGKFQAVVFLGMITGSRRLRLRLNAGSIAQCVNVVSALVRNTSDIYSVDFGNYLGGTYYTGVTGTWSVSNLTLPNLSNECTTTGGLVEVYYTVPY